jgi:GntR family transcriptional regulator, transcriptional repressor for pyruvate dehydrogenase complex
MRTIDSPHLTPINRMTVGEEIVHRLTNFIIDQGMKPGDKLPSERELMARLAVGRSSLREAVKILSGIGLIQVVGRGGMFVGGGETSVLSKPLAWALLLGEKSTHEVIEARRAVEVSLAGLAAQRATPEALVEIEHHLTGLSASIDDPEAFTRHDIEFHIAVARAAQNRVLGHILETLKYILQAWIESVISSNSGHPRSYEEHIPIVAAIQARDPEGARAAMGTHLDAAARRLLAVRLGGDGVRTKRLT